MSKIYALIIIVLVTIASIYFIVTNSDKSNNSVEQKKDVSTKQKVVVEETKFEGEEGEKISLVEGKIEIQAEPLDDGLARYYNVNLSNGDIIYFFVVKDSKGIYRAAANACQVCFGSKKGFRQEGDNMICNTCGNAYPLEKIATEKGGCNPGPINPDLKVENGKITITETELKEVSGFFN
ncbi:DUF2318 domain-containing protein [Patescibacteria group bacterium]|nr:DUF2318 domain-containing protein [Patescibacteria group bacterium]